MKKNILKIVIALVFVALFNLIYFLTGDGGRTASDWIAYGFIHASYIALVFSGTFSGEDGRTVEQSLPAFAISLIYFAATLVVGTVLILISLEGVKATIIIEALMLGVYLVILCTTLLANDHTADQVHKTKMERHYVKDCSADVKGIMDRTADRNIYKKLEKIYDIVHASPIASNDVAMEYELEVIRLIRVLDRNLMSGDNASAEQNIADILRNAETRNRKLGAGY